jgi:hypothetical protein
MTTGGTPAVIVANAGQMGDGYSWIVQILTQIEEGPLYDKLTQSNPSATNGGRLGRLRDAAFNQNTTQDAGATTRSATNPYIWETKIEVLRCPSYPGEEAVQGFWATTALNAAPVAAGNYVALAATHIKQSNNIGDLESSGTPPGTTGPCGGGGLCGNGTIAFPNAPSALNASSKVSTNGRGMRDMSDGTSKTVLIAETREENFTSWYSGFASYVVGAWPQRDEPEANVTAPMTGQPVFWSFLQVPNGDTALNKGDRDDTSGNTQISDRWYQNGMTGGNNHVTNNVPTGAVVGKRRWGPSSRHPGVVQHGWGDGRASIINDAVDRDVYLHLITRNGREASSIDRGNIVGF